ncbi:MAG: ABC transporter substrate-binding protein [Deltaproteobacteria bacterium]|nr:MAG: ABC transporter substrate-binding protein [Deltaproteobacteria bacterium]
MKLPRPAVISRLTLLVGLAAVTMAAAPDPQPVAVLDAAPSDASPCVLDHDSASRAVTDAYADLARVYRTRIPGPTGETLLHRRIDALLRRLVDVDAFCRHVLRDIWRVASPEQRDEWRDALDHMLRNRYLRGFEGPHQHLIEILRSVVSCHTATVRVALSGPNGGQPRVVDVELGHDQGEWRVFDVTLDGVSLVRTWRSRFLRIYRDGGVDAVDAQMRLLGERYRRGQGDDDL